MAYNIPDLICFGHDFGKRILLEFKSFSFVLNAMQYSKNMLYYGCKRIKSGLNVSFEKFN